MNYNQRRAPGPGSGYVNKKRPVSKKRRKKTSLTTHITRFFVFIVFFLLIGGIGAGAFWFNLTRLSPPPDILYTVHYTEVQNGRETEKELNISLPHSIGFAYRMYYFPITSIMDQLDLTLAGDDDEISLLRLKHGENIRLAGGSAAAYINETPYYLPAPYIASGGDIYVPLEFMGNVFENFSFAFDDDTPNKINVALGTAAGPCIRVNQTVKLSAVGESPDFGSYPVTFAAELSDYEQFFNPPADKAGEYLALMNHTNPLEPLDYVPPDLTDLVDTRSDRSARQLRYLPAMALEAFLIEARANGMNNITVTSAYRSYAEQSGLYYDEVARLRPTYGAEAEAIAAYSIMPPGHSEHQSGLGVDMHTISTGAAQEFGNTPEGIWLAENAHHFGFILRYPADKTDITGVKYEPWHFRYVGKWHAARIYERGVCLEEYLAQ